MDEQQQEVPIETYRPLSLAPEMETDPGTVVLRDEEGNYYSANRAELLGVLLSQEPGRATSST